tara:strand:+ start:2299 stop:2916 length:618 start_codon:yes stop_codon:yes gene_type:complete
MGAPKYGHWDTSLVGRFNPDDHLGFVYQITHKESGKSYIGCKHLWKFKKKKKVKASEWRYYCSSSKYLKPEIKKEGKKAFKFIIIMLCLNKRDLYYNEEKIQMELGVLENDMYYNANVGGKRFFRPVTSYSNKGFLNKISGTNHPRYRGPFRVTFKDGRVDTITDLTLSAYCDANGFYKCDIIKLRNGLIKQTKGIIKMEYDDER